MIASKILIYTLASGYGALVLTSTVQLLRIYQRVQNFTWTTQKLFLFLILLSSLVRCVFFIIIPYLHEEGKFFMENFDYPLFTILGSFPEILYFSTYTLLILFWAEIINRARNQSLSHPQRLRPIFIIINLFACLVIFSFWLFLFFDRSFANTIDIIINIYLSVIYLVATFGFIIYGGRLYLMLRQFPIESRGRRSKLKEVGRVSIVCITCFTIKSVLLLWSTFDKELDTQDIFIGVYYMIAEVIPSLLTLFILRKIPPKKEDIHMPYSKLDSNQIEHYDPAIYQPNLETN